MRVGAVGDCSGRRSPGLYLEAVGKRMDHARLRVRVCVHVCVHTCMCVRVCVWWVRDHVKLRGVYVCVYVCVCVAGQSLA